MLGISQGTRIMGLAVIRRGELIEWRVKTFKGTWSKDKLVYILQAIRKLCDYYQITGMAIKKVDPRRSSEQLDVLTGRLIAFAKQQHLSLTTYSLPELMDATGRKQRNLHYAIAGHVLDIYPVARQEYLKERNNEHAYYSKMFEAILCAHMGNLKEQKAV